MISDDNYYKRIGNLILTDYQVEILNKNNINLNIFNSNHELIYYLEDILNNVSNEELEEVSYELAELSYYNDINK